MKNILKKTHWIFIMLLITSCLTDKQKKKNIPINSTKDVLTNLAPSLSSFEIDPTKEITLTGKKGTQLYIPESAFQFKDGTQPTEKISITLKECYSLKDIIAENLTTTSGNQILETAGMIYINATANEQTLSVKDGKAFVVGFPKKGQSTVMELFYDIQLNDTLSTWIPDYKIPEVEAYLNNVPSEEGDGIFVDYPIEMTEDLYDYNFSYCLWTSPLDDITLKGTNETILDYIHNTSNIDATEAQQFLKNNWRVYVEFHIDKDGIMQNLKINEDSPTKNERAIQIVLDLLKTAPPFDLNTYNSDIRHDWKYNLGICGSKTINENRYKAKFRKQYANYKDKAIQQIDPGALNYYMFSATKLGWINCDKFSDINEDQKTNFAIHVNVSEDTKIQLVFKDIKSVMRGRYKNGKVVFNNIPLGREVTVIGISHTNGKPTMAVAETTISDTPFELSGFKEFTMDELDKELNRLNRL